MAKKKQKKQQGGGQQFLSPEKYLQQKARTLEIGTCLVTRDIDEMKMGQVFVTRRHTGGRISMAGYLVDMGCLGVKDSFYKLRMEEYEFDDFLADRRDMFRECSYEEAHNRIWGSIAYAEEAGIRPDKSFRLTQYMLEEDTDDIPLIEYEYGRDGKHFLTCRSELEASRYLPLMKKNLGEGNYHYIIGIGDPGFADEDYDDDAEAIYLPGETTVWNLPIDHLDVADIVDAKPVEGIAFVGSVMNIPLPDTTDKSGLQRQYTKHVLSHPEDLLRCLPKREMDMLLYILAHHDSAKGVPIADENARLMMELACVADCYCDIHDHYCVRVADDFRRVALPIAAEVRMSEEAQRRYEVETLVCGLANLYGMVSMEDVLHRMIRKEGMRRRDAEKLVTEAMEHSLLLKFMAERAKKKVKMLFTFTTDDILFFSTYAWDDRKAFVEAVINDNTIDRREFTDDEVREAGNGEPPLIPNDRQDDFWHFLTKEIGWDDYYAWRICTELWFKANHAGDKDNQNDTIEEYFENEALSLDDLTSEERQKGMRLLADYVAHIPRWTLKGHAPAEM